VTALGIRKIVGQHLTLYTDLPAMPEVDELCRVFDAAVPSWCSYFQVPTADVASWKNVGYVIQDKDRFKRAGFFPADLPPFLNGYQRGSELWAYEQPSAYYRRHLLLHEGTHAFMMRFLRSAGPPWYMEGMAELLATHRWQDSQLTLNYFPATKEEVPEWGRIKIVKDAFRKGQPKRLEDIFHYDSRAHLQVEPYGWSWATATFFDGHPLYRGPFRELRGHVREGTDKFSTGFLSRLPVSRTHLMREWELYVSRLDYGYDVSREAIEPRTVGPLPASGAEVKIAADRGWQSTGFRLEAGKAYRINASGRYQVAKLPKIWWCEPDGVTIRYAGGRPLGQLLGAIVDENDAAPPGSSGFLASAAIGRKFETTLRRSGTLYLRINDYAAELADNQGEVSVRIAPQ
jgi:hypothetical protein